MENTFPVTFVGKIGNKTSNVLQEVGEISKLFIGIIKSFSKLIKSRKLILF